jgi:polar amino acid transport system permease protein
MAAMREFFFTFIPTYFPFLLRGAALTVQLTVLSMGFAVGLGLLVAHGRLARVRVLDIALQTYVEIWRNIPLVVQLLVIYYMLPAIGISLPAFIAAVVGLSLNLAAYLSEVFRAAISAVDIGERDAGISIGMSRATVYRRVILPQAFLIAIPTLGSYFVGLLKDCSLVSFITVNELLRQGTIIIARTFRGVEVYMLVATMYFVMSFAASRIMRLIERKLTPSYKLAR